MTRIRPGASTKAHLDICGNVNPILVGGNSLSLNVNRAYYFRVTWGLPVLASKIAVDIGVSSGNICLGVYSNTGAGKNARPGTRKGTTGTVASPGTGRQEIALSAPTSVAIGDWLAIAVDNATIRILGESPAGHALMQGVGDLQDTAFPLPATAAAVQGNSGGRLFPLVAGP